MLLFPGLNLPVRQAGPRGYSGWRCIIWAKALSYLLPNINPWHGKDDLVGNPRGRSKGIKLFSSFIYFRS